MTVDLSKSVYDSLQKALKMAREYAENNDSVKAAQTYGECARLAKRYAAYAMNPAEKKRRLDQARTYESLKDKYLHPESFSRAESAPQNLQEAEARQTEREQLKEDIRNLIFRSPVSWNDIGGLEKTKEEIKLAFGIAMAQKPHGVKIKGLRNVLLYGPPGTGKTLLAAATSGALDATFFNVKISSLMSKYFGESSRLITALYDVARENAPSVVFIDEFESLCVSRGSSDSGAERRTLSNFLTELDGLSEKGKGDFILTIGSTNTPWLIDDAALSRFQKRIYVPLPDPKARASILDIHITRNGHRIQGRLELIADKLEGYSGREIERISEDAISSMIREMNPDLSRAVDKGKEGLKRYHLKVRPLREEEFLNIIEKSKPDTGMETLKRYEKWGMG